jgi:hypothetical protein
MTKKNTQNELRLRNSTAEFLTFAYQTGGDGVEVRIKLELSVFRSICFLKSCQNLLDNPQYLPTFYIFPLTCILNFCYIHIDLARSIWRQQNGFP